MKSHTEWNGNIFPFLHVELTSALEYGCTAVYWMCVKLNFSIIWTAVTKYVVICSLILVHLLVLFMYYYLYYASCCYYAKLFVFILNTSKTVMNMNCNKITERGKLLFQNWVFHEGLAKI
jgi:hypothetical protein